MCKQKKIKINNRTDQFEILKYQFNNNLSSNISKRKVSDKYSTFYKVIFSYNKDNK